MQERIDAGQSRNVTGCRKTHFVSSTVGVVEGIGIIGRIDKVDGLDGARQARCLRLRGVHRWGCGRPARKPVSAIADGKSAFHSHARCDARRSAVVPALCCRKASRRPCASPRMVAPVPATERRNYSTAMEAPYGASLRYLLERLLCLLMSLRGGFRVPFDGFCGIIGHAGA